MWGQFFITVFVTVAIVYLPGFLALRLSRLSALPSLICAPVVSIVIYEILGIVYAHFGVFGSWLTMFLPAVVLPGALYCGLKICKRVPKVRTSYKTWAECALYAGIALILVLFFFVQPLNGPMSFSQGPDNSAHLSYIQNFIESGNYSTLDASFYHGISSQYESPTGSESGGFYPTAWHCIAALAGSLIGANAALAINASLFVFLVFVFPLGVLLFVKLLAKDNHFLIVCGSLVCLAFGAFPWGFLTFGPLYPNFASFALVPVVVSIFMLMCSESEKRADRIKYILLLFFGFMSLAFLQTNALFTVGVILAPFCGVLIWRSVKKRYRKHKYALAIQILFLAIFVFLCAAIWYGINQMPFMQGIVSYPWAPFGSLRQELVNILLVSYSGSPAQPFLGFLVLLGIFYLLTKRENLWLVTTYGIVCVLCLAAAISSGALRSLLIGFWYTDSYRIAAMAALVGIPLAVYGVYALMKVLKRIWDWLAELFKGRKVGARLQVGLISTVFFAIIYYPNFTVIGIGDVQTAMGAFESGWFDTNNSLGACVMDGEEQKFLQEVSRVVPDGELVINKPDDGSVFAYGGFGIDVYYKRTGIEAYNTDSDDSKLIRMKLDEYASNEEVREAVKRAGSKYLLLLDQNTNDIKQERYWFDHYYEKSWVGMDAVTDNTPGFKVILAEGDMRLYEIVDPEE